MRILLFSDMHIRKENADCYEARISNLCEFIRLNIYEPLLIFVLGDIVDRGQPFRFATADTLFQKLKKELIDWDYKIFFIPGNHDYCDESRAQFDKFTLENQSCPAVEVSSHAKTFELEEFNFILYDSINNGKHNLPGSVDIAEVRTARRANKHMGNKS